jgi:hypothetical protein
MLHRLLTGVSLTTTLLLAGCSSQTIQAPIGDAANLPLLPAPQMLGTTRYGGAELPSAGTPERTLIESAVDRRLVGFTYYVDWPELEPSPGQYTLDTFTATLENLAAAGITPMVNVTVGDIEEYNLPPALSDGDGGIADGVTLADPAVLERFGQLLDRVVPIVLANGGFYLGVGNEIDARLDNDFPEERAPYVQFVAGARERVHAIEPRLAVGVTLTMTAIRDQSATFQALRAVCDVVPFNYAPIRPDFTVVERDGILGHFREVLAAYGSGPIVIQELTCPSAISMGASEAWQADCFQTLLAEVQSVPQVRFASVFTFQDFDAATCAAVQQALMGDELDNLPPDLAERVGDYFCELGMVLPDGRPKAAWPVVLEAAEALNPIP